MNRYFFYFFILVLLGGLHLVFGQERHVKPIIVIDPGHGGYDSGAIGVNGIKEKDVALKIALEVLRINKELFADTLEIYCTRYTDTLISLNHRTKLARVLQANVFTSIHCNQARRRAAQGVEAYINRSNGDSNLLAHLFLENLNQTLGYIRRGAKYGNFQVLRETPGCPSILLELGFLSNAEEAAHITKESSVSGYALLILETLIKYLSYD